MPTDRSRSREGENQRSESARRDASTSNGRIHDHMRHQSQLHDQQRNGKSAMTAEMQNQHIQQKQERWNNDHKSSIQAFIDQRGGRTLPSSEILLGYNKKRYPIDGGARPITENNLWRIRQDVANLIGCTNDFHLAVQGLITLVGKGDIDGVIGDLRVWKQGNYDEWTDQGTINQKKRFAEIMLD